MRMTALVLIAACAASAQSGAPGSGAGATAAAQTEPVSPHAVVERESAPEIALWFGGDVHLGQGSGPGLDALGRLFPGAWGVVNLEGAVAETVPRERSRGPGATPMLTNAIASLPHLRAAGVEVVTIANNHAFDLGPLSAQRTARAVAETGLKPAGLDAGVAVIEASGFRVVISAFDLSGGLPRSYLRNLNEARADGDVLVVALHETGPPSYLPSRRLRRAVELALRAGARIVVAHGTHAIGPMLRSGDAVIAWGLGNLSFACDCTEEDEGALLGVVIPRAGPIQACVVPVRAGLGGAAAAPSGDPNGVYDVLEALESSPLTRRGDRACF